MPSPPEETGLKIDELASLLSATAEGHNSGDLELTGAAPLESAGPEELSFVGGGGKAVELARSSKAGCLLVRPDFENTPPRPVIRVPEPRAAMARAIQYLYPTPKPEPGVHPSAVVSPDAELGDGVSVGPHAVIGAGTRIGPDTVIGAGVTIGDWVTIGARGLLHAGVRVYSGVLLGDQVILHSGCVIGAEGFGFVLVPGDGNPGHYEKFPQVGRVEIGDRVEIGANSCVDRAALGVTRIGEGTKLDNMVHIGHNCTIGRHVVIAAQTGLSGGVEVGDYAVIGGQVGVGDKARIEAGAILGSGSGVLTSKVVRAGSVMWGTPARPLKEHLAQLAALSKLAKAKKK